MKLEKKIKCIHCDTIISDGTCKCKKVSITQETVTEGKLGVDYIDVSQQLLNE